MRKGFTLIELVIVIAILGILAVVALPKFVNIINDAKTSATKAALGGVRSVIALKYSKSAVSGSPAYPTTIEGTDFFDGTVPINKLNNLSGITSVASAPTGQATSSANGWWFITTGTFAGSAGAYSDGTEDTSAW